MPKKMLNPRGIQTGIQALFNAVIADGGTREDVMEVLKHPSSVKKIAEILLEEKDELKRAISFNLPETFSRDGFFDGTSIGDYTGHCDTKFYYSGKIVTVKLFKPDSLLFSNYQTIQDISIQVLLKSADINNALFCGARSFDFLSSNQHLISAELRNFLWLFPGTSFKCFCGDISMRGFFFTEHKLLQRTIVCVNDMVNERSSNPPRIATFTNVGDL